MEKQSADSKEEALIRSLEDLVNAQDSDRAYAGSFLGFCARLLRLKPKADPGFKRSLERDLLGKHPVHIADKAVASSGHNINELWEWMQELALGWGRKLLIMKPLKRVAFGSVPVVAIALALIITIGNPRVDIARAVEILENDPEINAVIETYGLTVQHVKTWKGHGYILLDRDPDFDDVEVTIIVDLKQKTVWKIVADEGGELTKSEVTGYLDTKEADWAKQKRAWAAEAERQGMSFLEYITQLKKTGAVEFEKKAAAKGMTPKEYKIYLADEKAAEVEAYIDGFTAKAESMGMTVDEYKEYLTERKAGKVTGL